MTLHHCLSDEPAGLFSGPFREETEKGLGGRHGAGTPEIFVAFDLVLPGGTKKYSNVGVSSAVRGKYDARVESFGTIPREVSELDNQLSPIEMNVTILDTDRDFAMEVGSYRGSIRGSRATIRIVSPNVSDGDSFLAFDGVLDSYTQPEPMKWELKLIADDRPLRLGKVPKTAITQADWPAAHGDAIGQYLGPIYGVHNSNGTGNAGSVPALYVDTVDHTYAWMLGAGTATTVYSAGVGMLTTSYTSTTTTINGKLWSIVTFTSDQGDNEITLDVEGLTDQPDGTGTLITNPVEQLKHFLVNFVWNDWRSGAYYEESTAPLAVESFNRTAELLNAFGHRGSKRYAGTEQLNALDALNEWLDSHEIKAFWTNQCKLAVRPIDHRTQRLYFDTQVLKGSELALSFSRIFDPTNIVQKVSTQYIYNEAAAKYSQTLEVSDLSVNEDVTVSRALPWSEAEVI